VLQLQGQHADGSAAAGGPAAPGFTEAPNIGVSYERLLHLKMQVYDLLLRRHRVNIGVSYERLLHLKMQVYDLLLRRHRV